MTDPKRVLEEALSARYEFLEEVGQGARAVVYKALDRKLDRPVAIKVLRPEFSASLGADRFLTEISIAAKMTHPHILPLFDSGNADGLLYYVTPFVEGRSLRDRLEETETLPISDAVGYARQLAEALDYAHKKGIVHRDIKPENILLEEGKPVIADFGVARALTAAGGESLTATGVSVGTPHYMSPEEGMGEEEVDGRADLYGLGCMLFEMLTGKPPFTGSNARVVMAQHLNRAPESTSTIRPEVPVWLDRVTLKLLEKNPEDRYPTAGALAEELTAYASSDFDTVSDPWMRWLYRLHRRRKAILLGAVALVLAGLALILTNPGGEPVAPGPGPANFPRTNLAVLPLMDLSGGEGIDLASGFTEQLTRHLGNLEPLTVISYATMRENVRSALPIDSIIHRYRIGTLIEGSLMASDTEIQVSVGLTDAVSGEHLASIDPLVRPRNESVRLLVDLAEEVSRMLRQRLGIELNRRAIEAGTDCSECLELFFRAERLKDQVKPLFQAGEVDRAKETLTQADSLLGTVESMDPNWLEPSLARGWIEVYRARLFTPSAGEYDPEACTRGIRKAEQVLQQDPDSWRGLELRGVLRYYLALSPQEDLGRDSTMLAARSDMERAVQEAPSEAAVAWGILSEIHRQNGDFQQAKDAAEAALAADAWLINDETIVYRLCQVSIDLREFDEANHWCIDEGRNRFPDRSGFVSAELLLLASWAGREPDIQRAWALNDTLIASFSLPRQGSMAPYGLMDVAAVLARAQLPDSALAVVERARQMSPGDNPRLDYREANVRLQMGQEDEAIRLLAHYLEAYPNRREFIAADWWFDPLHDNPAFQKMVSGSEG